MKLHIIFTLAALAASPAFARELVVDTGMRSLPVAYEAMASGQNAAAIQHLESAKSLDAHDPSRLINLGTAYARVGRIADARSAYRAAIRTHTRYDLELSNGTMMDSREAARLALRSLTDRQFASR